MLERLKRAVSGSVRSHSAVSALDKARTDLLTLLDDYIDANTTFAERVNREAILSDPNTTFGKAVEGFKSQVINSLKELTIVEMLSHELVNEIDFNEYHVVLTAFENDVEGVPLHYHIFAEIMYVLKGSCVYDQHGSTAVEGSKVFMPAMTLHKFKPLSSGVALFLIKR